MTIAAHVTTLPRSTTFSPSTINVQDDAAGILMLGDPAGPVSRLRPGDVIQAEGTIEEIGGVTLLRVARLESLRHEAPIAPQYVVAADVLAHRYPGLLVRVWGDLEIPEKLEGSGVAEVRLRDRSGVLAIGVPEEFFRDRAFSARLLRGGSATVTGVASHRRGRIIPHEHGEFAFDRLPPYGTIITTGSLVVGLAMFGYVWSRRRVAQAHARKQAATMEALQASEWALRRSEAGYRSFVQNSPYGFYRALPDGTLIDVNPALVNMLGYESTGQLLNAKIMDVYVDPADRARLVEQHPMGVTGAELNWRRKDGTPLQIRLNARLVQNPQDGRDCYEVTVENITERRVLEQQLRQAQKLEAIGQLAGGVAHDFNNLLTAIIGFSALALDHLAEHHPAREDLTEIQKAGESAAALTGQLLAFSRKQILQPRVINLNDVVQRAESLLRRVIGERVSLVCILDEETGLVSADPTQIEQIIMNLAVNARDAMPDGGKLIIATQNADITDQFVAGRPGLSTGPHVMLAVSDTGVGMNPDVRSHLFEPFFTTKGPGEGTGLGLATVYGIVKQSGGSIWVSSEPGHGASFEIFLPRVSKADEVPTASLVSPTSLGGSETILLVEDEAAVRAIVRTTLAARGYTILEAGHGEEAIHVANRHHGPIHLLLTDMIMPKMGGRELADQIRLTQPHVRILYISGYNDDAVIRGGKLLSDEVFLQKPFSPHAILQKVREVLDMPASHVDGVVLR